AAPAATARPPRSTLYRAGAGAAAVVVLLLAVFLFTRSSDDEPGGLAAADTETPAESTSTGGEDARPDDPTSTPGAPGDASPAQDPPPQDPPAQDPQRQPPSPAGGTGAEQRSPTPDPAL